MTDPAKRMSLTQMRNHPWLSMAYESSRSNSAFALNEQQQQQQEAGASTATNNGEGVKRVVDDCLVNKKK